MFVFPEVEIITYLRSTIIIVRKAMPPAMLSSVSTNQEI